MRKIVTSHKIAELIASGKGCFPGFQEGEEIHLESKDNPPNTGDGWAVILRDNGTIKRMITLTQEQMQAAIAKVEKGA